MRWPAAKTRVAFDANERSIVPPGSRCDPKCPSRHEEFAAAGPRPARQQRLLPVDVKERLPRHPTVLMRTRHRTTRVRTGPTHHQNIGETTRHARIGRTVHHIVRMMPPRWQMPAPVHQLIVRHLVRVRYDEPVTLMNPMIKRHPAPGAVRGRTQKEHAGDYHSRSVFKEPHCAIHRQ